MQSRTVPTISHEVHSLTPLLTLSREVATTRHQVFLIEHLSLSAVSLKSRQSQDTEKILATQTHHRRGREDGQAQAEAARVRLLLRGS